MEGQPRGPGHRIGSGVCSPTRSICAFAIGFQSGLQPGFQTELHDSSGIESNSDRGWPGAFGGGYRDVWLDREGHDLGIWLQKQGITTLVLKYRTNYRPNQTEAAYPWADYLRAATADARQALQILRSQASSRHLDPEKIGIGGFSAGGHLALTVSLGMYGDNQPDATLPGPNFAGLFYPWLREDLTAEGIVEENDALPPMFFMNALDDRLTPADRCIEFFKRIHEKGVPSELHLYSQGGHGFDLGESKGASTPMWKESFVAWLADTGFIR